MFGFIWWILIGLMAGLLARFILPGKQSMGWLPFFRYVWYRSSGSQLPGIRSHHVYDRRDGGPRSLSRV